MVAADESRIKSRPDRKTGRDVDRLRSSALLLPLDSNMKMIPFRCKKVNKKLGGKGGVFGKEHQRKKGVMFWIARKPKVDTGHCRGYNAEKKQEVKAMETSLEKACRIMQEEGCTCVLCAEDRVYKSSHRGVKPLLDLLDENVDVRQASAADKVVGKATAFLYCLLGVKEVYGCIMSQPAARVLEAHGISAIWQTLVEGIVNRAGDGPCPMENATRHAETPEAALAAVRRALEQLRK